MSRYDAVIIGSGPAGLEAALNFTIREKHIALFGREGISKKISSAQRIDNYLGLPAISGEGLASRFREHLSSAGINIIPEMVNTVYPMGDYFAIATPAQALEASAVLLCTGVHSEKPLIGEEEFLGRGVSYCATCDAPLYRGKTVIVVGHSSDAVSETNFIAKLAGEVTFIPGKYGTEGLTGMIRITEGIPLEVRGGDKAESLALDAGTLCADAIFLLRDTIAPAALVPGLSIRNGFIDVDAGMQTNIPGLFAAGDCTGKPHQYMRAAGQGQTAALNAAAYLDSLMKRKDEK